VLSYVWPLTTVVIFIESLPEEDPYGSDPVFHGAIKRARNLRVIKSGGLPSRRRGTL
jgi:hypothetical protein